MKNSARRNKPQSGSKNGSANNNKGKNSAGPQPQTRSEVQEAAISEAAKADNARAQAAKASARKEAGDREVLYKVETKRDSGILKAYITFTYRVYHPRVTGRMLFYGLLIFLPGFFVKIQGLKIAFFVIGALVMLLALFRQYISLALTKNSDPDYRSGADFAYEFTQADASFYRNGEITSFIKNYKDIVSFYYDDKYYYMGLKNKDFFILPKNRFTIGDASEFEGFIYKKSKKACRWIPDNFKDKMAKRRAERAISKQ